MSSFKLYMGGFRQIQGVVIAESKEEAEAKLYEKLSLGSLPCELEEIELPDHVIVLKEYMENVKTSPIEVDELKISNTHFQMQMQAQESFNEIKETAKTKLKK